MVNRFGLILTMFFVMCIIVGCGKNNELIKIEKNYEDLYTYEVTITTEKSVYSIEDTVIKYFIHNPTSEEQPFIWDYTYLQKFDDGEWKIVAFKNEQEYFYDLGGGILPNATLEREMELDKEFYLPLDEGLYRLVKGDGSSVMVSNEFEIKQEV